ncbi:MAG TPA: 4-alpha-glucanotransferase [Steroidobacteraceae bacterium]|nr:4-alpha-glucanotransferase [Steroidobacteraceae bacterium]
MTTHKRRAGVLLHLTSLPAAAHQGALGEHARRFVDLLADSGFAVWQMLPVGPVDEDRSPYFSRSVHAGDPGLIDLGDLVQAGLISPGVPHPNEPWAHFRKRRLLEALIGFENGADARARADYDAFVAAHRRWLLDDGLFLALKAEHQGSPWWQWRPELRDCDAGALQAAHERHRAAVEQFVFEQYLFQRQWRALRTHAQQRGVALFGDIPIYVAHDSVETWAHRENFQLDAHGAPLAVAGVPPDYFSADGQLWGNPLYDWRAMQLDRFSWWMTRLATQLERFDLLRIDHFRGLESYWEVPAHASSARAGAWQPAAGAALLERARERFGELPLVAEDLGVITPAVDQLRRRFDLPGMRILQFAFDGSPANPYLPHNHQARTVVYTGTHDNDTTRGWFDKLDANARRHVLEYLGCRGEEIVPAMVRAALTSVAELAILPLQDLLGLASAARMNTPGTTSGNWRWAFEWDELPADFIARWSHMNRLYGRA